jgi:RNA polymerase sigma-70 factor, ECF subfamily
MSRCRSTNEPLGPLADQHRFEDPGSVDAVLVAAAQAGDTTAFGQLVRRYERQCAVIALRLLGNSHDAAELVQDCLVRAFESISQLKDARRFASWLFRIVTNRALNLRRSRGRRKALSLEQMRSEQNEPGGTGPAMVTGTGPDRSMDSAELGAAIQKAMDRLPDKQRAALVLFTLEELPQKEVAEILECSVEAVKWYVFTARRQLRRELADYF